MMKQRSFFHHKFAAGDFCLFRSELPVIAEKFHLHILFADFVLQVPRSHPADIVADYGSVKTAFLSAELQIVAFDTI